MCNSIVTISIWAEKIQIDGERWIREGSSYPAVTLELRAYKYLI